MESNLEVWKASHQLTLAVYKITQNFPKAEQFGLISQVRRSASSVPTNIIEDKQDNIKKNLFSFCMFQKVHWKKRIIICFCPRSWDILKKMIITFFWNCVPE